jgi:hypothetical protein
MQYGLAATVRPVTRGRALPIGVLHVGIPRPSEPHLTIDDRSTRRAGLPQLRAVLALVPVG